MRSLLITLKLLVAAILLISFTIGFALTGCNQKTSEFLKLQSPKGINDKLDRIQKENIKDIQSLYQSIKDLNQTNSKTYTHYNTNDYIFDTDHYNNTNLFTVSYNSTNIIVIHYDGSVTLASTNLDEMSKKFWDNVGKTYESYFCKYCRTNN